SELRPRQTPPTRPRRQPPTQLRALPDRDHPGALPPRRARLSRTQTSRRQKPPRSHPLPQTTTRTRRLQQAKNEPSLDIGATLAETSDDSRGGLCGIREELDAVAVVVGDSQLSQGARIGPSSSRDSPRAASAVACSSRLDTAIVTNALPARAGSAVTYTDPKVVTCQTAS